jgi:hypothetical protein
MNKIICIILEEVPIVFFLQGSLWILVIAVLSFATGFYSSSALMPSIYRVAAIMFLLLSSLSFLLLQVIKSRLTDGH